MNSTRDLFDWLLERSWQAALLAVLIMMVQRICGARLAAKWRYGLWFVLIGQLLLPSLPESSLSIYNFFPKIETFSGATSDRMGALIALPIRNSEPLPSVPITQSSKVETEEKMVAMSSETPGVMQWLAFLWAGVAFGLMGFLFIVNLRFAWRVRSSMAPVELRTHEILHACQKELGIKRRVQLIETSAVESPAIMGIFRPALLMPKGFARHLSQTEMRHVFLHELGHLVRGDVITNALAAFIQTLHWFNPILWWAFSRMRADRELACDAWVLSRVGVQERRSYGETLLKLMGRFQPSRRMAGMVGVLENKQTVKIRIERIARFSAKNHRWSFAGAALATGLALFFLTGAKTPDSRFSNSEKNGVSNDPSIGRICDRNGVVLVEFRHRRDGKKEVSYPLGAFAAQLLVSLDESAQPKAGETVYLTLDARIQTITEQELRKVGRGAAVVLDPNSGDILAMASVPSFDPNKFVSAVIEKDWLELSQDKSSPLMNRALNAYTPGGIFLPVTALAGISAGLEKRQFECHGSMPIGRVLFHCWKPDGHGSLTLPDALKGSCNVFFFQYGIAAGGKMQAMAGHLGLGLTSGIPVHGEAAGVVDGPGRLKRTAPSSPWSDGYAANISIGQAAMLVTPLQMAGMMEAIGNGGILHWPRLVEKVSRLNEPSTRQPAGRIRANLLSNGVTRSGLELVRLGLWKTVNEHGGTARKASSSELYVAGRTGTAQQWRIEGDRKIADNQTWFAGFAPFKNPRYAIAVLVQGAKSGGGVSAPLAGEMLHRFEGGSDTFPTEPLKPARGHFDFIERILFGDEASTGATEPPAAASVSDHSSPIAKRVPGTRGKVISPFSGKTVDVSGYPSGEVVKDPYSGKTFKVP